MQPVPAIYNSMHLIVDAVFVDIQLSRGPEIYSQSEEELKS